MKQRFYLFIISLFVVLTTSAQMVTGTILDSDDQSPLEGATVWYKNRPNNKAKANEKGEYRIRYTKGGTLVFHYFGYKDKEVTVKNQQVINVKLGINIHDIKGVTIEGKRKKYTKKNNPAVTMMEKVIAARKGIDYHQQDYASFDKYQRIMLAINDINGKTLGDEHMRKLKLPEEFAEFCPETGKMILPISFEEKQTHEMYRKSDNTTKSVIQGEHHESLLDILQMADFFEKYIKAQFTDVDIYKDNTIVLKHNFISPIGGSAALRFFHYALGDTIYEDGEKCYTVYFSPANLQDIGWTGMLYVKADSTWAVKRAQMNISSQSNTNFVKNLKIDQSFSPEANGQQICTHNRMIMQLQVASWLNNIHVDYNVNYRNWSFDPIPSDNMNFLGEEKLEKGAHRRDSTFWAVNRPDTVSYSQTHVNEMKKRFVDRPVIKTIVYVCKLFLDNYIETSTDPNKPSKVDIGPFLSLIGHDETEGFRLRLGFQTTGAFSPHWYLSGWVKYGFKDKRWKGMGEVAYSFNEKEKRYISWPQRTLAVSYTRDIHRPSDKFMEYDKDNMLTSILWDKTRLESYFDQYKIQYDWEWENHVGLNVYLNRESNTGVGDMYYITQKDWDNNKRTSDKITYTEMSACFTYQPGAKIVNTRTRRYLANREVPTYSIRHTTGVKGVLGGDYNYNYTSATYYKRFWTKSWGSFDGYANASIQWNRVPYPLLVVPSSNLAYIKNDNTFCLIKSMEFLNDRSFSMMWKWHPDGKFFNRIPLIKKLKWREEFGCNAMWGYLTDKNNPNKHTGDDFLYNLPGEWNSDHTKYTSKTQMMNSWTPYVEVYAGIHNIWKFFSVDYFHRITYHHDGSQNWGLRFAFEATF